MSDENRFTSRRRAHAIVIGLLVAVASAFGCSEQHLVIERVSSRSVDVVVRYPERMVRGAIDSLSVDIHNVSTRALEDVVLLLDSAYAPSWNGPLGVGARGGYAIRLQPIAPEDSRTISALVPALRDEGVQWGRVAVAVGSDTVAIHLHTIIGRE